MQGYSNNSSTQQEEETKEGQWIVLVCVCVWVIVLWNKKDKTKEIRSDQIKVGRCGPVWRVEEGASWQGAVCVTL